MKSTLDIIALVQNNPLTRLTSDYGSKIIERINRNFTEQEQHLFVANFYCYLNYDTRKDFVIDIDNVWKWIGFGKKGDCKNLLVNNFVENEHYKIILADEKGFSASAAKPLNHPEWGGLNKETILLTIYCFKKLCLKTKTKKSDQIHEYYIKMEEMMNELVDEQTTELRIKLSIKDQQIKQVEDKHDEILVRNSIESSAVYLALIDTNVVKFGHFKKGRAEDRLNEHKREIGPSFHLKYIIQTEYDRQLEDFIKEECRNKESILYDRRITRKINGKNQTELIQLDDDFTIEDLYSEVIKMKEKYQINKIKDQSEEIKKLRSIVYDSKHPKPISAPSQTSDPDPELLNLAKCSTCSNIEEPAKIGINKITGQIYSQCVDCRKKYSDLNISKNEVVRKKNEEEAEKKKQEIADKRELLLSGTEIFRCFACKKNKFPVDMGINRITNQLYKTCSLCRIKKEENNQIKLGVKSETESECSKCHNYFENEFNEISKTNYKTCTNCREKYNTARKKDKEDDVTDTDIIECTYCHKDAPKEINAKKDGFYKSCKECRETRKRYDKKKNEVHRDAILEQKKEYYAENREEIRIKQKEYYSENRETILASKAHTSDN